MSTINRENLRLNFDGSLTKDASFCSVLVAPKATTLSWFVKQHRATGIPTRNTLCGRSFGLLYERRLVLRSAFQQIIELVSIEPNAQASIVSSFIDNGVSFANQTILKRGIATLKNAEVWNDAGAFLKKYPDLSCPSRRNDVLGLRRLFDEL